MIIIPKNISTESGEIRRRDVIWAWREGGWDRQAEGEQEYGGWEEQNKWGLKSGGELA